MHDALLSTLALGLEGAVYVAAVMLGSAVSLYAAHFLVIGIVGRNR